MTQLVSVVSRGAEGFPGSHAHVVDSLADLRSVLEPLLDHAPRPTTVLDLIGHSTRDLRVVRLGRDAIDMFDPRVDRFFRRLAADRVPERLGLVAVRLLGCATATLPSGQRTMIRLARVLGVRVLGTTKVLFRSHYTSNGFNPLFERTCLVDAAQLARRSPWQS